MKSVGEKMPRLSLLERSRVRFLGTAKIAIKANLENLYLNSKP